MQEGRNSICTDKDPDFEKYISRQQFVSEGNELFDRNDGYEILGGMEAIYKLQAVLKPTENCAELSTP